MKAVTLTDEEYEVLIEYRKKQNLKERLTVLKKTIEKKFTNCKKYVMK
ncbi:hypothetical protein HMPREF9466_01602 [Fusobacterium necrophorum subsp. funduliforme 1_1_36S]|nr:hypothetical protein HMPREF9466_01602 [Fusobacterium necrophorum subsp. funduliforme 1_1_36S]